MASSTDKSEFTIFLPSNVIGTTENYISHYTTLLSSPIMLDPNDVYEVGLHSVIYPNTALNAYDATMSYYSFSFGFEMPVSVPSGFFASIELLLTELSSLLGSDAEHYKFTVDSNAHKVIIELRGDGITTPKIQFSQNLEVLLGLPNTINRTGFLAGRPYDMSGGIASMFIYSNLCNYSNVGTTTAPLLGVVPYTNTTVGTYGQHISFEPRQILYHPMSMTEIELVEIEVRTKIGNYLPFSGGTFLAVLIIRKRGMKL